MATQEVEQLRQYIRQNGPINFTSNNLFYSISVDAAGKFRRKITKTANLIPIIPGVWTTDKWVEDNIDLIRDSTRIPPPQPPRPPAQPPSIPPQTPRQPPRMPPPIYGGQDETRALLNVSARSEKISLKVDITVILGVSEETKQTPFSLLVTPSIKYRLKAPKNHERNNKSYKFQEWVVFSGFETEKYEEETIELTISHEFMRAVAVYREETDVLLQPYYGDFQTRFDTTARGPGEAEHFPGPQGPGFLRRLPRYLTRRGRAQTLGGRSEIKETGFERKSLAYRSMIDRGQEHPRIRMAINRGKRELNNQAKQISDTLYTEYADELRTVQQEYTEARNQYFVWKRQMARTVRAGVGFFRYTIRRGFKMPMGLGGSQELLDDALGRMNIVGDRAELQRRYQRFSRAEGKMNEMFTSRITTLADAINARLEPAAKAIAKKYIYRFKIPTEFLTGLAQGNDIITTELVAEARAVADLYAKNGRARLKGMFGFVTRLSMKSHTLRDVWYTMLYNIWDFIWGPMVLGLAMAFIVMAGFISFFIIPTYALNASLFLYIIPLAGAAINWVMNFESNKYALDHLDSMVSGALIAQGITIFLFALIGQPGLYLDTFYYYMLFAFLFIFFGIFQFYQTGGFPIVLKMSVIVLIFGWVALGPYKATYEGAINQVRTPVLVAWRAGTNVVSDISLLVTNPTAWYAKQQTTNVRPERSMAIPRALEITSIDLLPPSVPQGAEFAMFMVIKNDGDLPARSISLIDDKSGKPKVTCNSYCKFSENKDDIKLPSPDSKTGEVFLLPGEAGKIEIRGLKAIYEQDRRAESRLGIVYINLSYDYSTNSSLLVSVMSKNEFARRFAEREDVFRQVVAVGKVSPAQLSLNVGPQPLESGKRALLLVSVSNARDDGRIFLRQFKDVIVIRMQKVIGSGLECGAGGIPLDKPKDLFIGARKIHVDFDPNREEALVYVMQNNQEIRQYEFSSIFSILCSFQPVPDNNLATAGVQTGLITAELPTYEFRIIKEQTIPITGFIGIVANPSDTACNQCGSQFGLGIVNTCTRSACNSINPQKGQCWLDTSNSALGTSIVDTGICRACAEKSCSTFTQKYDCETEASQRCSLNCKWEPSTATTSVGVGIASIDVLDPTKNGICVAKTTSGTTPTGAITCNVEGLPLNYVNQYNIQKDVIKGAVERSGLKTAAEQRGYNGEALLAALISQESQWNAIAVSKCSSAGLVQFIPGTARKFGLFVPFYPMVSTNDCPGFTQISNCCVSISNSNCNINNCDLVKDERFKPEKAIPAATQHLTAEIGRCNGVKEGLGGYNGGTSCREANAGYTDRILKDWYPKWVSCFNQAIQAQQATTTLSDGPDYCSKIVQQSRGTEQCVLGQGGCKSNNECDSRKTYSTPTPSGEQMVGLECRNPGNGIMLCCREKVTGYDSDADCIKEFDTWKVTIK